jgi:cell division protein FtsQ
VRPLRRVRRTHVRRRRPARALVIGCAVLVLGVSAYLVARTTSAFAVRSIQVDGAPPPLAGAVDRALAPLAGKSLVSLDQAEVVRRVLSLPEVASARVDRAFPHTIRVSLRVEQPAAILRQGAGAWLVATDARVLRRLTVRPYPSLPRIWVPRTIAVVLGAPLVGDAETGVHVADAVESARFPAGVRSVQVRAGDAALVLRSGVAVRLGDLEDLRLKLAVAARILRAAVGARYVDVAVPDRAVAAYNSQVEG